MSRLGTAKIWKYWAIVTLTGTIGTLEAQASSSGGSMAILGDATPPIGYVEFCRNRPDDCASRRTTPRRVVLTSASLADLTRINDLVNTAIEPMTDLELYGVQEKWTYPVSAGDCEDYVLLKRKLLIEAGWPRETLLITVVRDEKGDGHAVLTVVTSEGDLVLDNQRSTIETFDRTPYRYIKRQSQKDQNRWVAVGAGVETPVAATPAR